MFLLPVKWEAGSCRGKGKAEEGLGLGERRSQGEDAGSRRTHPAPRLRSSAASQNVGYTDPAHLTQTAVFGPDTKHFASVNALILTTAQREKGLVSL